MNMRLIGYTKDAEQIVAVAVRQCYSALSGTQLKKKITAEKRAKLIAQVVACDHTSTIEHVSFTFAIEGVSRVLTHELVRHRIASYSQQSQRYVTAENFKYIIPPSIKNNKQALKNYKKIILQDQKAYNDLLNLKIAKEDARFVLPNATETKIIVTMNARSLFNFLRRRMCNRAQWEIRTLAQKMHKLLMKVAPNIFKYAGPTCKTEKICWEGKLNCGLPNIKKDIEIKSHIS
ncbi:MAG: FAD-dependent thymidylate synthase [Patescibacteria group bacterium]|nr:FAD-dependent thymidylate synthase [Patescibacteria group bacterium]